MNRLLGIIDMRIVTVISILSVIVLASGNEHDTQAEDPSKLVTLLNNPDQRTRATAAAKMGRLIAADPSSKTNDHGKEYWKKRVESVTPGMKHADVKKMLPAYDHNSSGEMRIGSGDSHVLTWRLDHYWTVTIQYRNPGTVIERPKLNNKAMHIWVKPPATFTGTWVTWYVNGQKSHEIEYKNGKYHGAFISFHDNGRKSVQQHYRNGVCSGADSGWYPDGSKAYHGSYADGKQTGTWTHWDRDGNIKSSKTMDVPDKE